jgi:hypothetical protein
MGPQSIKHRSASIAIRTALVISTIGVAVLVPFFGEFLFLLDTSPPASRLSQKCG